MEPQTQEKKSNGALVGAVIVILLIIIGGVYLLTSQISQNEEAVPQIEEQIITEEVINGEDISSAVINSLDSIEKDLETIDTNIVLENLE